jgi:glyoxylase-like metal-dependent hydrolase (beta-lactamase superfamily II)
MNIETRVLGDFQTNAYIVWTEPDDICIIIDAPDPAEPLIQAVRDAGMTPELLLLTHGHLDHIAGSDDLRQAFPGIRVAASSQTAKMMRRPSLNLSVLLGGPRTFQPPDDVLEDGSHVTAGATRLRAIGLDGHAPGSLCFLAEEVPPTVFTGDTLFAGSIGRTDFPGGSLQDLLAGIRRNIMTLSDDTVVYSGHGPCTTVAAERGNPFLTAAGLAN